MRINLILVCIRMLLGCHSYVSVCTRMLVVCDSYVFVCTGMYLCVTRKLPVVRVVF